MYTYFIILSIIFLTQGALGSRQTCWPVFFRVALQYQARNKHVVRAIRCNRIGKPPSINIYMA